MFCDPAPSPYDLNFKLFGFPVRIHYGFWLGALILGSNNFRSLKEMLIWVSAMFAAILIHELGHAFAGRYFGAYPSIILYAMGGLTSDARNYESERTAFRRVFISFAGPGAGFLFVAAVAMVARLTGVPVTWEKPFDFFPNQLSFFPIIYFASPILSFWVYLVIWMSIVWGLLNLLPIYPLDGGQIARNLLLSLPIPDPFLISLCLSFGCASVVALYCGANRSWLAALFFGSFAYDNFRMIQSYRSRRGW